MNTNGIRHYSLLIIGNGFDKNCGLKTSYTDVYEDYLRQPPNSDIISSFKENIGDSYDKWSDFEEGMAAYATSFDNENSFMECLTDFNRYMHDYLSAIQQQFHESWGRMTKHEAVTNECKSFILSLGLGLTHNIDHIIEERIDRNNPTFDLDIISFNYTDVFDWIYDKSFYGKIHHAPVHVHGMLGDDPILGMDREEQLHVKFPITDRLKRSFLKPFLNEEYDSHRIQFAKALIKRADTIFVYGASLGESDLTWRELLIEWLRANKNNHLFIYDYANAIMSFRTISERMNYEERKRYELFVKWGISDFDEIRNQMHLPCGVNTIDLKEALIKDSSTDEA